MSAQPITLAQGGAIISMFNKYIDDLLAKAGNFDHWYDVFSTDPRAQLRDLRDTKVKWLIDNLADASENSDYNFAASGRWISEAKNLENILRNTAGFDGSQVTKFGKVDDYINLPLPGNAPGGSVGDMAGDIFNTVDQATREATGMAFDTAGKLVDWSGKTIGGFVGAIVEGMGPGGMFILTVAAIIVVGAVVYKKS